MAVLPVEYSELVNKLNLPSDINLENLFSAHALQIRLYLKRYVETDFFEAAYLESDDEDFSDSFELGYCYLMLSMCLEFMNLKTLGQGIIKTIGMDTQSTSLLTGKEITDFKVKLELKALDLIFDYLNSYGINHMRELEIKVSGNRFMKRARVSIISGDTDE